MSWFLVIMAGLFEVVGVAGIAQYNKKASLQSALMLGGGFLISFILLSLGMKDMPMGTAYAVWTGIGTVGSALVGILFFRESKNFLRILFIAFVLGAVIGLKLIG
ncbi:DMT family transporter [Paenibacillus paeoniae]|uniref:QacE family quaternary ammonium compound efflux SMR transporter n=1 Tax=Paenibacillus paeoniae TaxID=2292705 RepID=A0A371PLJ8_9BACL|nr:multidrug efflux SMR transporter [Paenibacillus paeoniae]REK77076.1 QacE family quaternary ammonium compound efflux SMR transporter [Paenibacillus paeoniae]